MVHCELDGTVVFGVGRVRRACGDSDRTGVAVTTFEMYVVESELEHKNPTITPFAFIRRCCLDNEWLPSR